MIVYHILWQTRPAFDRIVPMKTRIATFFLIPLAIHAADLSLSMPNMAFEINGDATGARFAFPRNTAANKDFWRLILDDGDRTEIPVFSRDQKGRAVVNGKSLPAGHLSFSVTSVLH